MYGEAISSTSSMDRIRSMMGVCPQFDVLWGELSGIEHLKIYGHVKGIHWREVENQSDTLLEKVIHAVKSRAGSRMLRLAQSGWISIQCQAAHCPPHNSGQADLRWQAAHFGLLRWHEAPP